MRQPQTIPALHPQAPQLHPHMPTTLGPQSPPQRLQGGRGVRSHQPKLLRLLAPCARVLAIRPSCRLPAHGAAPARWLQLAPGEGEGRRLCCPPWDGDRRCHGPLITLWVPLGAGRALGPLWLAGRGRSAVRAGTWLGTKRGDFEQPPDGTEPCGGAQQPPPVPAVLCGSLPRAAWG